MNGWGIGHFSKQGFQSRFLRCAAKLNGGILLPFVDSLSQLQPAKLRLPDKQASVLGWIAVCEIMRTGEIKNQVFVIVSSEGIGCL